MYEYAILGAWLLGASTAKDNPAILALAGLASIGMFYLKDKLQTPGAHSKPVQMAGKGTGVCLFCPGLHSNIRMTSTCQPVKDLVEQFATVVLFDYTPGASAMDDLLDDTMRMLVVCGGPGECTIAGHSMGGSVALYTAVRARRAGWRGRINVICFAAPAHTGEGINLPTTSLLGVKVFAPKLDLAAACRELGAPATLVVVHCLDDPIVSVEHGRLIAESAKLAGIDVHYYERPRGGHKVLSS
jgi:hypothetical protein